MDVKKVLQGIREQAKHLLVDCPYYKQKIHCFACSKCKLQDKCTAWYELKDTVGFYQTSAAGAPLSWHALYNYKPEE